MNPVSRTKTQTMSHPLSIAFGIAFLLGFSGLVPALRPWALLALSASVLAAWYSRGAASPARWATRLWYHRFFLSLVLLGILATALLLMSAPLGGAQSPVDIDEGRLAQTVRHFFLEGEIPHKTVEDYPGLHYWQMVAVTLLQLLAGLKSGATHSITAIPIWKLVEVGRQLNAFLYGGIVVLTGLIARQMMPAGWALLAAALAAASSLGLKTAGHHRNETTLLLLIAASLLAALVAVRTSRREHLIAAGVLAGLAAGVKYTGVFAVLPALLAAMCVERRPRWRCAALVVTGAAAAFLVSQPFVVLDFPNFVEQLQTEIAMTGSGHWTATDNPSRFYTGSLLATFGTLSVLAAAGASLVGIARLDAKVGLLLAFSVPYQLFMTGQPAQFDRWVFPLVPVVAVLAALGLRQALTFVDSRLPMTWRPPTAAAVIVAATIVPAITVVRHIDLSWSPTTYDMLAQWRAEDGPALWLVEEDWMSDWSVGDDLVRTRTMESLLASRSPVLGAFDRVLVPEPFVGLLPASGLRQIVRIDAYVGGRQQARGFDFLVAAPQQQDLYRSLDLAIDGPRAARFLGDGWFDPEDGGGRRPGPGAWMVLPIQRVRGALLRLTFDAPVGADGLWIAIDRSSAAPPLNCESLDSPSAKLAEGPVGTDPSNGTHVCSWAVEPRASAFSTLVRVMPQGTTWPLLRRVRALQSAATIN